MASFQSATGLEPRSSSKQACHLNKNMKPQHVSSLSAPARKRDGTFLQRVIDALMAGDVFRRTRKSIWLRGLGIVLYDLALNLRDASMVLGSIEEGASHKAVREWYGMAKALFRARRRPRRAIVVDEARVKVQGRECTWTRLAGIGMPSTAVAYSKSTEH